MNITIFGANGKVGRLIVAQTLKKGYQVVAFTRNPSSFDEQPGLRVVQGDIYDEAAVAQALDGSDVVISALGSWGTPKKNVLTVGTQHIIPAMEARGIKRIISLTGHEAQASHTPNGLIHSFSRCLLKVFAKKILVDGEQHIRLLEQSQLDWTVVRSSLMNERGNPQNFKLTAAWPLPWATVNRNSVATGMVMMIEDTSWVRKAPFIVRS